MLRKTRKWIIPALLTVGVVYLLNAAIIFFSNPISIQENPKAITNQEKYGSVSVQTVKKLQSGGIGGWSRSVAGYVNMTSADQTIYVKDSGKGKIPARDTYLYRHELTHILQKELVAKKAGGYPSYWNPVQSVKYYYYLVQLNSDLEELMPPVNEKHNGWVPFAGIEAAADCYAQPYSDDETQVFYSAPYLAPKHCNIEQTTIAGKLINLEWPKPLTAEQKSYLKEVNIISEPYDEASKEELKKMIKNFNQFSKAVANSVVKAR